ncbi:SNF2-related protein [Thalassotalea atypica]|uniref:SNF2-related protein n=1 Tax=Thalassotalea atypica TaxID=2054316 RepID=UPI0025732E61|nr:SNF2-related protein [Thalassotalea atypica]
MQITPYQAKYFAHELTIQHASNGVDRLSQSLFDASVDLNPHQINAALFALSNPLSKGVVLADEVGLGKTIEAGLVLSQYWAERRRTLLIICPASLRRQWAQELKDKFNLPTQILDAKTWKQLQKEGVYNPLAQSCISIVSYHFAVRMEEKLLIEPWDIVVFDEAHKLRNAHRKSNKMGQALKRTFEGRNKLLLTATPIQNSLMELYGLSTIIDDTLFGDDKAFRQQYVQNDRALASLQVRLKSFIQRTLRKDVLEYVRYTKRQTLTVPFLPSPQEQDLYNGISSLLEKDESYALPKRQRHLTGLILRKLLASSTYAVLNTLSTIKQRLEKLRAGEILNTHLIESLTDGDDLEQDYVDEYYYEEPLVEESEIDHQLLASEIAELEYYIDQASNIKVDSKAKALLIALSQGFEQMEFMGAPRKVIIFTESKRTQEYLENYLNANGYLDKIVTFSGTNNKPLATEIYQNWRDENKDSDIVSGSAQIDRRSALIDYFKNSAEIMIATEAAAEGVNLQFCSLIINYDLPWNPQRVEQRIGRCHRYGQKFDVVVINFLNESNKADQRVLELLTEKFHLFDGVFGASDDILGSIESGVDFEKRIQFIYDNCRTPDQIESAFSQLRKELEKDINEKMTQTRQLLLDNFDEDIHDLLKIQLDAANQRLDKIGRWFWALSKFQLKDHAVFNEQEHSFELNSPLAESPTGKYQLIRRNKKSNEALLPHTYTYRLTHPLGEWAIENAKSLSLDNAHITFDYSNHEAKVSMVKGLVGKSGTLTLQKFSIESLERNEDYLLFAAIDENNNIISSEVTQKLMQLSAVMEQHNSVIKPSEETENILESILNDDRNKTTKNVNDRNLTFFEQEVIKLDSWADDLKEGLEQTIKELDKEIKQVRREAKIAATLEEKLSMQKQQRKLESLRNKSRKELFDKQDEVDERREELIDNLEAKLSKKTEIESLFTIQWSVK